MLLSMLAQASGPVELPLVGARCKMRLGRLLSQDVKVEIRRA
jgi:hypothetical protein